MFNCQCRIQDFPEDSATTPRPPIHHWLPTFQKNKRTFLLLKNFLEDKLILTSSVLPLSCCNCGCWINKIRIKLPDLWMAWWCKRGDNMKFSHCSYGYQMPAGIHVVYEWSVGIRTFDNRDIPIHLDKYKLYPKAILRACFVCKGDETIVPSSGGSMGDAHPSRSKFFHFHAVFGPLGNPGSTTADCKLQRPFGRSPHSLFRYFHSTGIVPKSWNGSAFALVDSRGGLLSAIFLSFSCSFWQNIGQIIGSPHGNPGSWTWEKLGQGRPFTPLICHCIERVWFINFYLPLPFFLWSPKTIQSVFVWCLFE